jgi:hypothetical protein
MLKRVLIIACCCASFGTAYAQKSSAPKRKHGAHEHHAAKLGVIAEGNDIAVDLEASGESIVGFEHEAKKPEDKAKQEAALNTLRDGIIEILGLDPELGCKIASSSLEVDHDHGHGHSDHDKTKHDHGKKEEASHSEVEAEFKVNCLKPVAGAQLKIDFSKHFPGIKKVRVTTSKEAKTVEKFPALIKL